jgi:hypothetical protein
VWTLVYQCDIQNYCQISIPRSCSKLKLDREFSVDLGLKGGKITRNITKVGVSTCLPMGNSNLFSNFNSEKLVKVKTPPCVFARLALKWCEISLERHESWCAHMSTNGASKSMLKFKFQEVGESRNSTMRFR